MSKYQNAIICHLNPEDIIIISLGFERDVGCAFLVVPAFAIRMAAVRAESNECAGQLGRRLDALGNLVPINAARLRCVAIDAAAFAFDGARLVAIEVLSFPSALDLHPVRFIFRVIMVFIFGMKHLVVDQSMVFTLGHLGAL